MLMIFSVKKIALYPQPLHQALHRLIAFSQAAAILENLPD
jgi:hypothetical protein